MTILKNPNALVGVLNLLFGSKIRYDIEIVLESETEDANKRSINSLVELIERDLEIIKKRFDL